jgi:hypothetical protein
MALSPNYGWAEPDNSSLVKNGAQDIRALGDAIDTSVWNVGFGKAGGNKFINGDFNINQRAFTSTTTSGVYIYDRFLTTAAGTDGTSTFSAQTFTPGTAPVAGYEGKNYLRIVTTGQTATDCATAFNQYIENVRTFAGQTVTVSFWAKANSGTPSIGIRARQAFGGGGSSNVDTYSTATTISTSWARYSKTISIPSISGKTIGTNVNEWLGFTFIVSAGSAAFGGLSGVAIQNNTFDIWGVQVEYGSKATPFQTASGGSPQAELAMCQRYFAKSYSQSDAVGASTSLSSVVYELATASTGAMHQAVRFPVSMRGVPTVTLYDQLGASGKVYKGANGKTADTFYIGSEAFAGGTTDATSTTLMVFQYTASAEL